MGSVILDAQIVRLGRREVQHVFKNSETLLIQHRVLFI